MHGQALLIERLDPPYNAPVRRTTPAEPLVPRLHAAETLMDESPAKACFLGGGHRAEAVG